MIFNADKSKCIHFLCSSSKSEKLQICFDGKTLTKTSIECHLGNIIGPNIKNSRIKRLTDDLYMRTNQLLSSFGFIKGNVKRKLFFHFVWQCTAPNFETTPPMLLRHFIPRGGNVSGALMDYLIKLIKLYYLYCGMLNPYMFSFINVL